MASQEGEPKRRKTREKIITILGSWIPHVSLFKRLQPKIIRVAFSQLRYGKRNQRQLIWQGDGNDETTDWTFVPHNDG